MIRQHTPFLQTRPAAEAAGVIAEVIKARGVGLVIGDSGCGKSALLRSFEDEGETALLYRGEVVNTPRSLVQTLLQQLGVMWTGSTRVGFSALRTRMREARCHVVLVDDAQRLTRTTLDMLRALHEGTGVAIVLAGTRVLPHYLTRKRGELAHRVALMHEVGALGLDDVLAFVRRGCHSRKRRSYWECVALSRALLRASGGNFRRLLQALHRARALARLRHRPLDARFVALAHPLLPRVA